MPTRSLSRKAYAVVSTNDVLWHHHRFLPYPSLTYGHCCEQVELQRRMLEEYEKRDRARKVGLLVAPLLLRFLQGRTVQSDSMASPVAGRPCACCVGLQHAKPMRLQHANQESCMVLMQVRDIQEVCPGVSEQEAIKALEMCTSR